MTVKTLFEETLSLGFEDSYEISRVFLFAARRALRTIAAEWGGTYSRTVVPRSEGGEDTSEGISLAEYISDYLAPSSPPLDKDGKRIVGAQICGEVLILPKGYTGEVTALHWIGLILVCFVLPAVLSLIFDAIFRKCKLVKDGDMKLDL